MKKLTIMITALALVLGMAQCKKNINPLTSEDEKNGVFVTLKAGIDNGEKTEIFPDGLVHWTEGDILYVVGSTQGYLGKLTTDITESSVTAVFEGYIDAIESQQDIHFYYVGKDKSENDFNTEACTYDFSIETQDGTLDGIRKTMHVMHSQVNAAAGQTDFGEIDMHNLMSIAKLDISGYIGSATCTGAYSNCALNLKTGEWDAATLQQKTITLSNPTDKYFMALLPSAEKQTLTFQSTDFPEPVAISKMIKAGKLYTLGNLASIPVKPADWVDFNDPETETEGMPLWSKTNLDATCLSTAAPNGSPAATTWYGRYYAWGELEPYALEDKFQTYRFIGENNSIWCEHPYHDETFEFSEGHGYQKWNYFCKKSEGGPYNEWDPAPYDGENNVLSVDPEMLSTNHRGDAARYVLGGQWRMPTKDEWQQLKENTYFVWTKNYAGIEDLDGYIIYKVKATDDKNCITYSSGKTYRGDALLSPGTGPTGYSPDDTHIFLPRAYVRVVKSFGNEDIHFYWSSTLCTTVKTYMNAYSFFFTGTSVNCQYYNRVRDDGMPIRPVMDKP